MPAKSRDIPPKKFDFPGFEGHLELFGPHPFTWKTPTHRKISGLECLGLCSVFVPESKSYLDSVLTLYREVQSATAGVYFRLHGPDLLKQRSS